MLISLLLKRTFKGILKRVLPFVRSMHATRHVSFYRQAFFCLSFEYFVSMTIKKMNALLDSMLQLTVICIANF